MTCSRLILVKTRRGKFIGNCSEAILLGIVFAVKRNLELGVCFRIRKEN